MPGYAFISYSRTDRDYVVQLAQELKRAGIAVWYDYNVHVGDQFPQRIQAAIDRCSAFVLVLTPESVSSKWVQRELTRAARLKKPLLPLQLRPCDVPIEVEGIHHEDVASAQMPAQTFIDHLASLMAGRGLRTFARPPLRHAESPASLGARVGHRLGPVGRIGYACLLHCRQCAQ